MKNFITRSIATAVIFATSAPAVFAENYLDNIGSAINAKGGSNEPLENIIGGIITSLLGVLGVIALIIVIISGFQWMMAGGDSEKVKTAKNRMINGVIGLAIILAAYSITNFIFKAFSEATNTSIQ